MKYRNKRLPMNKVVQGYGALLLENTPVQSHVATIDQRHTFSAYQSAENHRIFPSFFRT